MLTVGIASLLQAIGGYRMTMYEGPAAAYLAAVAAVATGGDDVLPEISGGLLAGAALVVVLGIVRADRIIRPWFTPLVTVAFLLMVCVMVIPAGLGRAIDRGADAPAGTPAGWATLAVVVVVALGARRVAALGLYALLLALVAGTGASAILAAPPSPAIRGGFTAPELLPWGPPDFGAWTVAPFLVAGALAAVNAVGAIGVGSAQPGPPPVGAHRRGLLVNGGANVAGAALGNVIGTVPRMDSLAIAQLLGNGRRLALVLAAAGFVMLGFWRPFTAAIAALPLTVTAALLVLILATLVVHGLRTAAAFSRRERWLVLVPALAPTAVWLAVAPALGPTGQLLLNPLAWGVLLAVGLERRLARSAT